MKSKKLILTLVACLMALLLLATSCGDKVTPKESEPTETEEPEITTTTTTSEPETQPSTEEKTETEPSVDDSDKGDAVEANTWETAADLGVWIATKKFGKDTQLGNLRYRVTSISDDQDAILAAIKAYNDDDENFRKINTEIPANYSLRLCEFEVIYEKDFPGYGDSNTTVYSPALDFGIGAEGGGGLDTADGLTHIGLTCIDISKKVTSIETGELYKGAFIYAIPDNVIEQYYVTYYYSTQDAEGNYLSVYSYVKPEVIKGQ